LLHRKGESRQIKKAPQAGKVKSIESQKPNRLDLVETPMMCSVVVPDGERRLEWWAMPWMEVMKVGEMPHLSEAFENVGACALPRD